MMALTTFGCTSLQHLDDRAWEHSGKQDAFSRIVTEPALPQNFAYLLQKCRQHRSLHFAATLHVNICNNGMDDYRVLGNYLVAMFADCRSLDHAQQAFHRLVRQEEPSWTALIYGYIENEQLHHALCLYARMRSDDVLPSKYTFLALLKACARLKSLDRCHEIESEIVDWKLSKDLFIGNAMVDMYAKCGSLQEAQRVFDELPTQDVVSWNALITGYAEQGRVNVAVECLREMQTKGVLPNPVTYLVCLKACSNSRQIEKGRVIHVEVTKLGLENDELHSNTLLDMYGKCGLPTESQKIFDSLNKHDVISWTALISCYADQGFGETALLYLDRMLSEGVLPNVVTFICCLTACAKMASVQGGHKVHNLIIHMGFENGTFIGNSLLSMYAKCGSIMEAQVVFDHLVTTDVVSWSALIAGYSELGLHEQAVDLFEEMQLKGVSPNEISWNAVILGVAHHAETEKALNLYQKMQEKGDLPNSMTFASVLKAFGNATALLNGIRIHSLVHKAVSGRTEIVLATALIDMYRKCGNMVEAREVFDALESKDLVAWSAMITGYAQIGEIEAVFNIFEKMQDEGLQPDEMTFLSVLNICSHAGLVDKGRKYFECLSQANASLITIKHVNCMVDLLGRAGRLEEAILILEGTSFNPDISTFSTMLSACRMWGNVKLGMRVFEGAVRVDRKKQAPYILMYNIYADAHMWEEAKKTQAMYAKVQATEGSGQSWTEIDDLVYSFRGKDPVDMEERIYEKL